VAISLLEAPGVQIYIVASQEAGAYPLAGRSNAFGALQLAGGTSDTGNLDRSSIAALGRTPDMTWSICAPSSKDGHPAVRSIRATSVRDCRIGGAAGELQRAEGVDRAASDRPRLLDLATDIDLDARRLQQRDRHFRILQPLDRRLGVTSEASLKVRPPISTSPAPSGGGAVGTDQHVLVEFGVSGKAICSLSPFRCDSAGQRPTGFELAGDRQISGCLGSIPCVVQPQGSSRAARTGGEQRFGGGRHSHR